MLKWLVITCLSIALCACGSSSKTTADSTGGDGCSTCGLDSSAADMLTPGDTSLGDASGDGATLDIAPGDASLDGSLADASADGSLADASADGSLADASADGSLDDLSLVDLSSDGAPNDSTPDTSLGDGTQDAVTDASTLDAAPSDASPDGTADTVAQSDVADTATVDVATSDAPEDAAPIDSDEDALADDGTPDVTLDATPDSGGSDPLAGLSDEFDDAATLLSWKRIYQVEGWPHDQLEGLDINSSRAGWLMMMPYSSTWYQDYRGVLMFKLVTGDFVVTTSVEVRNRAGNGAPGQLFSLGGIFVRRPRDTITQPSDWTAGNPQSNVPDGENYMFLSLGCANTPGTYQTEVKRTRNSDSVLQIDLDVDPQTNDHTHNLGAALIRVARIGQYFIMMIRFPTDPVWRIHRRYHHDLMPETLQVGITTYTDWNSVARVYPDNPFGHNISALPLDDSTTPDLVARFDYYRFRTPSVPENLQGVDLTDDAGVTDAELRAFLGFD
ncbi:MAG: hypothetical protein KC609_06785 [Myxococcales bacterium]|nr:hypothetical protein [Myxococcales bacterium]